MNVTGYQRRQSPLPVSRAVVLAAELDIKGTQAEKLLAEVDKLRYLRRMSQQSAASATQVI